ncbi:MAG: class I SAM-dependent methyltransferase [Anaeromyxobacteraceae bacterium]
MRIGQADGDVRYVPDEDAPHGATFCSVGHESRYLWARDAFPLAGARVLDFGCGSGYGVALLAERAGEVLGLDRSPVSIDHARRRYAKPNTTFAVADLEDPRLPVTLAERFDFVFSFDVVEHTERYYTFVENVSRLLRPGGVAVIGCPNRVMTLELNVRWNVHHVQEFTPAQLAWLTSLYFERCELLGQDLADERKRAALVGGVADSRKKGLARAAWKWRRSLGKRLPFLRDPAARQAERFANEDVRFSPLDPGQEPASRAFGLLAVCRSPRPRAR